MNRLCFVTVACVLALTMFPMLAAAQSGASQPAGTAVMHKWSIININSIWYRFHGDGVGGSTGKNQAVSYPTQLGNLVFSDNLIWAVKVSDGKQPEYRTGGGTYLAFNGTLPGAIVTKGVAESPDSATARIFRIRSDLAKADLTSDAAGYFETTPSEVTPEMLDALRSQYQQDWQEWPWQKGAPFYDLNHNGIMDAGESPGLAGADQVAWYSYNDLDEATCMRFQGTPPLGLEVQVTLWAYRDVPNLGDVLFKRYRVLYKGTSTTLPTAAIDSMYLLAWVDPDIGTATNDLGGCDSTLSLGYAYNHGDPDLAYRDIGVNPAIGYVLLQGPLVRGTSTDEGMFGFRALKGVKNLPMTSFTLHTTGGGDALVDPAHGTPSTFYWDIARGIKPWDRVTKWKNPDGTPTNFMCAGDPVAKTGWYALRGGIDFPPQNPGDPRFYMNMGPCAMAVGDTQEIVLAVIATHAPTAVENSTYLKNLANGLHMIYPDLAGYAASFRSITSVTPPSVPSEFVLEQNYPNPFNPLTQLRFSIPETGPVKLVIFDVLGRQTRVLHDEVLSAGRHFTSWDGRDDSGSPAPSGVYFGRLMCGVKQQTRKMLLTR